MATAFIDPTNKNRIGKKLTVCIGEAVENGQLQVENIPEVCKCILTVIDTISTYDDLKQFFNKLATTWPFFTEVISTENQKDKMIASLDTMFQRSQR